MSMTSAKTEPLPAFTRVATSRTMVSNGVVARKDKILVAGPRWSGSKSPAVGRMVDGKAVIDDGSLR
jgi:hypothetical protein